MLLSLPKEVVTVDWQLAYRFKAATITSSPLQHSDVIITRCQKNPIGCVTAKFEFCDGEHRSSQFSLYLQSRCHLYEVFFNKLSSILHKYLLLKVAVNLSLSAFSTLIQNENKSRTQHSSTKIHRRLNRLLFYQRLLIFLTAVVHV